MFAFFLALVLHYVLARTKFGKSLSAVGGNAEAVLLLAVALDSVARRSRASHGRA